MATDKFEKAFGDFLDQDAYDEAETSLLRMVRESFQALGGRRRRNAQAGCRYPAFYAKG